MALSSTELTPALHRYMLDHGVREPAALARLREKAASLPEREMQSGPEVAGLVALLVEITGAREVIEVGTFVGYTTGWIALALPEGGRVIACDVSERYTAYGKVCWAEAGIAERVDLRIAPALETLDGLIGEGHTGRFDLVFIDADKGNYGNYYDRAMQLVRVGGLVLIDNVFWSGKVADPKDKGDDTKAIRALNERLRKDKRVHLSMLPIGDGLTLARKVGD